MKLTTQEAAQCLDIPMGTIERWIRQGRIPVQKSGEDYTFRQSVLKQWAEAHSLSFSVPKKVPKPRQNSRPASLLSTMERGGMFHDVAGDNVEDVLRSAVGRISFLSRDAEEELHERLLEREQLISTGIGRGIAVPHPRTPLSEGIEQSAIVTCFLEKPVDFRAVDDRPVFVMFILLSTSTKTHLHLLSRLSFCLRDKAFVAFLKTSPNTDEFFLMFDV